ncbi:MAG: methylenetetrahydrofolate reductase [Gammaproteobacteria bacterium]|nr:methylenetetrahydrofolate reductase [Gammaproteobacteria bacterium]
MLSMTEQEILAHTVHEAYMEIFPTPTIEAKLDVLEPGSYVAVTCSPSKGVDVTLDMSERLANRGFKVVPHIAAKMVRDEAHLKEILRHLDDLPIISIFVPGGDAEKPVGQYTCALDLLQAISESDHKFTEIGVAAHPEGHPSVDNEVMLEHLLRKQSFSNYMVTQMCFDAHLIGDWLREMRSAGVTLPAWIGLPGVSDRSTLLKTSLRIGVGNSLRYLRSNSKIAARLMMSKSYRPDELLAGLAPFIADPLYNIAGHHIYCFNEVARSEEWRHEFLESLHGAT